MDATEIQTAEGRLSDYLVVGLDVGGTSTRALVANRAGDRLGTGRAAGGNPTAHGGEAAAGEIRAALDAALAGLDPAEVRAGVIGLAGAGKLAADPVARQALDAAWHGAGLRTAYRLVGDALLGYAAGTPAPDGTVLVAGTGAIAAAVRGFALDRIADGHGWLLGDLGSGFWIGREAVRLALAVLDNVEGGPAAGVADGPLARSVRSRLIGTDVVADPPRATASALVQAVHARPPVALAELAPLVFEVCAVDPAARRLVDRAAGHLVDTLALVHTAGQPLVLAGGLLAADTPLARLVGTRIAQRWPGARARRAGDTAAAAAWLAGRALPGVDPVALHARLVTVGSSTTTRA